MTNKYLLFTNIRGVKEEQEAIYRATQLCDYQIIMLAPSIPEHLKPLTAIYQYNDNKNEDLSIQNAIHLSKQYRIESVFSWTDTDVVLASKISQALNIPSIHPNAAYKARNKYKMRQTILQHYPEWVPTFTEINQLQDIYTQVNKVGFPAILKPISASGSKGIFVIHSLEEAIQAYNTLTNLVNDTEEGWFYNRYGHTFILESFIIGQEFSVEGVVVNGDIAIAGITDKLTTDDWHLEYRHIFPARYPADVCRAIEDATSKIIQTLGMDNCPFHLEGKWTETGFKLIEIAARIGGDLIHTHLIPNSLNLDWLSFVIQALTDRRLPCLPNQSFSKFTGIQFVLADHSHKFLGLNLKHLSEFPSGVIHIEELIPHNTPIIMPPQDFTMQRLGFILAEGTDYTILEQLLSKTTEKLSS